VNIEAASRRVEIIKIMEELAELTKRIHNDMVSDIKKGVPDTIGWRWMRADAETIHRLSNEIALYLKEIEKETK
jgi:hypothetical protein